MKDDKKSSSMSRRTFIKEIGTGVVGTTMAIHGLEKVAEAQNVTDPPPPHRERQPLTLTVNSKKVTALVEPCTSLADFLRLQLKLTGTKIVCNHGECGACTVLLEGKAVYSCHMLAVDAAEKKVITIEGLLKMEKLHPIQKAFWEHDGYQCGFCTPGQIMAAQAILIDNAHPNREEIRLGMSGNLCRCGAYPKIIESVVAAAQKMNP
jgi:aerobic-type carbon monoxide dehydrogenase small subunit (CoxS/CutS family)